MNLEITQEQEARLQTALKGIAGKFSKNENIECIYCAPYALPANVLVITLACKEASKVDKDEITEFNRSYYGDEALKTFGYNLFICIEYAKKFTGTINTPADQDRMNSLANAQILFDRSNTITDIQNTYNESLKNNMQSHKM